MSLPLSTEFGLPGAPRGLLPLLIALFVIAGCAAAPNVGDSAKANDPANEAVARPKIPPKVLTLYEQAVAVMAAGDLVEGELRFKEFLLQHRGYPGAHVNLAIIHATNGNDSAAEESITRALAVDPEHPPALNQLGMLRRRQGRFLDAEAAYMKAVTASPDYALAHYNLGVLNELYLQRLDAALRHFERYQELGGEDEQVARWIVDLTRRVSTSQRTANARE